MARQKKQSIPGCDLFMCAAAVKYRGLLLLVIPMSYHKCAAVGHILPLCFNFCCAFNATTIFSCRIPPTGIEGRWLGHHWVRCSGKSGVSLWSHADVKSRRSSGLNCRAWKGQVERRGSCSVSPLMWVHRKPQELSSCRVVQFTPQQAAGEPIFSKRWQQLMIF